jgi:hypothetical protein
MTDEQKQPEKDEEVEAHHWKTGPSEARIQDAERAAARSDEDEDDVEAHHWKTGPSEARLAGPEKFS